MKALYITAFIICFAFLTPFCIAQGQGKGQNDQAKGKQDIKTEQGKDKAVENKRIKDIESTETGNREKPANKQSAEDDKESQGKGNSYGKNEFKGKGHAYGRNKGDMTGHEYGKLRSQDAKNKMYEKFNEADVKLDTQMGRVNDMRKKVEDAKVSNEEKFKSGKISKKEYDANKAKISEAEEIVNNAEQRVKTEKQNVQSGRAEINK